MILHNAVGLIGTKVHSTTLERTFASWDTRTAIRARRVPHIRKVRPVRQLLTNVVRFTRVVVASLFAAKA
jgi:hypothetical protein